MNAIRVIWIAGMLGAALALGASRLAAQACPDGRAMSDFTVKSAADAAEAIKKESEAEFETKFHQKSFLNKLTFAINALGETVQCLDKASQDSAAPADQAAARSAKDADTKLKDRLSQYKTSLKETTDPKSAKALIATFDLTPSPAK
jgi:hypothetical protein